MRILHVTDLHYSSKIGSLTKQKKLLENFKEDLKKINSKIDFVIFSGDLVKNGSISGDFKLAQEALINHILSELKLDKSNFLICAGNHDVDRAKVSKSVVKYLDEELKTNEELNDFFNKRNPDLDTSFVPLKNYHSFIKRFYNGVQEKDFFEEMYSVHIRDSKNGKIGFVSLNTAWRSIGIEDDGNLLFPTSKIDKALDQILNCEIKVLIHHHPISNLKGFNEYVVEDLVHKGFHFIFSGHIHKNSLSIDLTPNDGVVKLGTSANLSFDDRSKLGYSIIELDYDKLVFTVNFRMYDIDNEQFYHLEPKKYNIPSTEEKKEQNKLRIHIREKFFEVLEDSKSLFVENKNKKESKDLLELSTIPVLKNKSLSQIYNDENSCPDFQWKKFYNLDKDYIIYGKDKCGKTILLKKIEIELLKDYSTHDFLPFYIDVKEWSKSQKQFVFEREFAKYYSVNIQSARNLFETKNIILLLDNFQVENESVISSLERLVHSHENFRLVICSINNTLSSFESSRFNGRDLSKLYFHPLRKIHIKQLTKKSYELSDEKQDQIVEKIDAIFKKLSIPFNYWTISIFLWVFNKDGNNNLNNDVDLINLYIEKLLEKEQLTLNSSVFTFNNYKKLLAYLAHFLLVNYHETSYYAKYSEIIEFIQQELDRNPRIRTNPKEVFEYLDDKGLLRKKGVDQYSFRLKGVFEYFIALYMTFDQKFLEESIKDENYYLAFSNEFEIYAGFKRDDQVFLETIFTKTQRIFKGLNQLYKIEHSNIDSILQSKVVEADQFGKLIEKYVKKFQNSLTEIEKDKLEEEMSREMRQDESHSEVKKKEVLKINNSSESLEESLNILGKVYRNIDDINDVELVYRIFDYVIENACLWSFRLLDEFGEMDISEIVQNDKNGEAKNLLKLISNVVPTLVQVRLYNMIGHINLEGVILKRLSEAKKKPKTNQFKLFIYSFLLCDINYYQHKEIINEVIPHIKMSVIKYSFILKLNYYLNFKTNLRREDKQFLKNNIQSQHLRFNNKTDLGVIQKGLSKKDNKIPSNYKK